MNLRYLLILFILISSTQVRADEIFNFNSENNTLTIHTKNPSTINFFAEFSQKTNIKVRCAPSIPEQLQLPALSFTLKQLTRSLDSQFSTIKGFDDKGNLTSLDVLPLGSDRTVELIPIAEVLRNRHSEPTDTTNNLLPSHIDIRNIQKSDWENLTKEQTKALKYAIKAHNKKEEERKRSIEKNERNDNFKNTLTDLKETNPELHAIMIERYAARIERDEKHEEKLREKETLREQND